MNVRITHGANHAQEVGAEHMRVALPTQTIGGEAVRDTVLFLGASISASSRTGLPARAFDLPAGFPHR